MPVDMDNPGNNPDSLRGMERTPYASDSIRVRCPHCRKLYLVQFTDVQEARPRFECVQCHSRFWISLPEMDLSSELEGIPLHVKEVPSPPRGRKLELKRELEPCPKCFRTNPVGSSECAHCGVMIAKAREGLQFDDTPPHSSMLAATWKRVMADYGDENVHADFMKQSQSERNLPYAAAQYAQMSKLMPTDEITKKRIQEIQALAAVMVPPKVDPKPKQYYPRLWQIPLFGAALLIIVGLVLPMFRNIVGLGAAFLFLAIAMQLQMRRRD